MKKTVCPDCAGTHLKMKGKLPESNEFSGNTLDHFLDGGNLYFCKDCDLGFRYPVLTEKEYNDLYNTENKNWIFDENRNDWKLLKSFVEKNIPVNGKILDFGCNLGDVLEKLPDWLQKSGIEINTQAAEIAQSRLNVKIWDSFSSISGDLQFDMIYAIDVIEHLHSPQSFVLQALPFVKKNGFIALMTGDSKGLIAKLSGSKWYYSAYPEHIAFISKSWAKKLCKNLGNLEMAYFRNYMGTNRPFLKRLKWFSVWVINFLLGEMGSHFFRRFPKFAKSGMGEMKNFGKNFSSDHLIVVFRKL